MARKKEVEDDDDDEVYHVEVITKARVSEDGDWEYLVKWAGYGSDADSWEPSENVKQCDRLLTSFWKHVGTDDEDYAIGYEIAAQEDWIKKEKRYFKETFVKSSKRVMVKEAGKTERSKSKATSSRKSVSTEGDTNDSSDESSKKKPVYRPLPADTESDSESEVPLRKLLKGYPHSKRIVTTSKETNETRAHVNQQESLSMTRSVPSAPVIAPPKVAAIRTHQDQKSNPLVKPLSIPSRSIEAGSSLSTKQRIAAGIPPPRLGPKPLQAIPKKSLSSLSFRKNKPSLPVSIPKDVDAGSSSSTIVASVAPRDIGATDDVPVFNSPQPMDVDENVDLFALDDAGTFGGSVEMPTIPLPSKTQEQIDTEKFLQTINIPELSTPLETDGLPDKNDTLLSRLAKPSLTIPKILKKWKWSGDLFISTSESKAELLCPVTIADSSGTSNSSYINLLLSPVDSLRISRLYPIMDLIPIIRSCGKPQYFGRLDASDPNEEEIVQGLNYHLTNEALVAAIPLSLDGSEVAILLMIPGVQKGLARFLQVPGKLVENDPILVVLLTFSVSVITAAKKAGWRSLQTESHSLISSWPNMKITNELSQKATLSQAIALLGFPKTLLDFLNNTTSIKTYSLWPLFEQLSPGLDAFLLLHILKSTKATPVKVEEDTRTIFISNRHLETLHTLPYFVSKRVNSPQTQFWTFGHCINISSVNWKLQEVFPLGGIVTFTAAAIAEDLMGCYHLMSQIAKHPLWACYLIPEVLAALYFSYSGSLNLSNETCLDSILELIDLGMISLMRVPGQDSTDKEAWLSQVFDQLCHTGHELLALCLSALKIQHDISDITAEQLFAATTTMVINNLMKAQIHPTFMKSYRRFIVIKSVEDPIPSDSHGLEWCSLSAFDFKDDFFHT